jgi:hypothetical protein
MTTSTLPEPPVTDGEEIRISRCRRILALLGCLALLCISTTWVFAPDETDVARIEFPTQWRLPTLRVGGLLLLAVTGYAIFQFVGPLVRDRRIVLGSDRLQLVEGRRVLGQVPYDNIEKMVVDRVGRGGFGVWFTLYDYARPDTFWDNPPGFHQYLKRKDGFDLFIEPGFREYPEEIRRRILDRSPLKR